MITDTPATGDACAHPTEARSILQDGHTQFCTACQTRLDAPTAVVYEPRARLWGDEPDPIPAAPTVLVASTDPKISADGNDAREYAPKPALNAAKDALAGGWRHEFTYAAAHVSERGEPGKRGHKPAHVLHTVALRLARDTDSMTYDADGPIMIRERGYAVWAREDAITEPTAGGIGSGKWAWHSARINDRAYGARELRARLLRHGRELLADPPRGVEMAAPAATPSPVPVAPILPGSWGSLHAGDTVKGANGAPYVVQTIAHTGVWVGAGQPEVRVMLHGPDGAEITVTKSAAEPAVIADTASTSEAAAIVAAVLGPVKESIVDQFSGPAARKEPPIGKYRWYKLPHPITGDPEALWPRVSTIVKTHADKEGLTDWQIHMAMKGLAVSPDLIAMVASLDIDSNKGKFREAAEQAANRAASKKGANFGTALDRFTERLDAGESIGSMGVPDGLRGDVEAYGATLRDHGLEVLPHLSQRTILNETHGYAGTWDRIVRRTSDGELFVLDVKRAKPDAETGLLSPYSRLEYASQVAAYAHGEWMCDLDFNAYDRMPDVSLTKGLILHIAPGTGRGELHGVRLECGWRNFVRSIETRHDRSEARTGWTWLIERPRAAAPAPVVEPTPVAAPINESAVHDLVARDIAAATTIAALCEVAYNATEAGVWTDALAEMALGRDDQLRARTAADHAGLAALWSELTGAGRWTPEVAAHADARAVELAST